MFDIFFVGNTDVSNSDTTSRLIRSRERASILRALDTPVKHGFPKVVRDGIRAIEALYDDTKFVLLTQNEKTTIASKMERSIKKLFDLPKQSGRRSGDTAIDGIRLEVKFTVNNACCWTIPPENVDTWLLLAMGDPIKNQCGLGFLFADQSIMNVGTNRDKKTTLKAAEMRTAIEWLIPVTSLGYHDEALDTFAI